LSWGDLLDAGLVRKEKIVLPIGDDGRRSALLDLPVRSHKNLKKQLIDYVVDQTREAIALTNSYGEVRDGVKYLRIISACHNFRAGLKWRIWSWWREMQRHQLPGRVASGIE
jgi:hypothetical protein